jgi:hypothetical protein
MGMLQEFQEIYRANSMSIIIAGIIVLLNLISWVFVLPYINKRRYAQPQNLFRTLPVIDENRAEEKAAAAKSITIFIPDFSRERLRERLATKAVFKEIAEGKTVRILVPEGCVADTPEKVIREVENCFGSSPSERAKIIRKNTSAFIVKKADIDKAIEGSLEGIFDLIAEAIVFDGEFVVVTETENNKMHSSKRVVLSDSNRAIVQIIKAIENGFQSPQPIS